MVTQPHERGGPAADQAQRGVVAQVPEEQGERHPTRLLDLPERLLGCALSHAVEEAVSARTGALGTRLDPVAFAVHVTEVLRDFAVGGHPCPPPAPEWLAASCRWNVAVAALAARVRAAGPDASPHPDSGAWAERYGRAIPGSTCGEQFAAAREWKAAAWVQLTPAHRRLLAFGVRTPSAIEKAVGGRAGTAQWRPRLTAMMASAFADGTWAVPWLAPRRLAAGLGSNGLPSAAP